MTEENRTPSRRTERFRTLIVWVAVTAILLSGWALWDFWDQRHTIDEACGGLVPPGAVLDLSAAEGEISGRPGEDGSIDLGAQLPQECRLHGSDRGTQFFTARVAVEPNDWTSEPEDDPLARIFRDGPGTSGFADQPLGGGINGTVGDDGVVVRLPCPGAAPTGDREVKNVVAMAILDETHDEYRAEDGQLLPSDRDTLAAIAVEAANGLADKLGCDGGRLPEPPEDIPAVETGPVAADRADGTCEWYGRGDFPEGAEWLPDQAYEARTSRDVWSERCLLRVSQERAARAVAQHRDDPDYGDFYQHHDLGSALWGSMESFFGEPARHVVTDPYSEDEHAPPGGAGRSTDNAIWWASSVCDGRPAVHTLTLARPYTEAAAPYYAPVFRAYVKDVAQRRGCTDVHFPDATTFTRR